MEKSVMEKGVVVYVGGFELPDKNAAAHRCIANGKILKELGFEVVFVGVDQSGMAASGVKRSSEDFFGFESWSTPYPSGIQDWISYTLGEDVIKFFKSYKKPIKAVICYNYPSVSQSRIMFLGKKRKFSVVSDITEWYDTSSGKFFYRMAKKIDTFLRMHIVSVLSQGVITTSEYMTQFYRKRKKITVELPTLQDSSKFQAPDAVLFDGARKFVYVGSPFDPKNVNKKRSNVKERLDKAIEIFYEVYRRGGSFIFDIIGIDMKSYLTVYPEHKDMLSEMSDCVRFHGRQSHSYSVDYVKAAHYSIFFRDVNRVTLAGFPSKLSESITIGTPVVTNKMISVDKYSDEKSIIQLERGSEVGSIIDLIDRSARQIVDQKICAFSSRRFDYSSYRNVFGGFLSRLNLF